MARARGKITSGVTRGGRKNKALTWTAPIERIFDQAVEDKDTVVLETLLANASAGHAFLTYDLSNIKQVWLRAKGHKIELRDLLYFVVEKGDLKTTKFLLKYGQAHELQYPEVLTIAAIAKRNRSDIFCCLLQQDWVKWYPDSRTGLFVAKVVAKCGSQRDKKLSNKYQKAIEKFMRFVVALEIEKYDQIGEQLVAPKEGREALIQLLGFRRSRDSPTH